MLFLHCLFYCYVINALETVFSTEDIEANVHDSVNLTCSIEDTKRVLGVTWRKETMRGSEDIAAHRIDGGIYIKSGLESKVRFVNDDINPSTIRIYNLGINDTSCYVCLFDLFPYEITFRTICVHVTGVHGSVIYDNTDGVPVVTCKATAFPKAAIQWNTSLSYKVYSVNTEIVVDTGMTYTSQTIKIFDTIKSSDYLMCVIINDNEELFIPVHLIGTHIKETKCNMGIVIASGILILIAIIIICLELIIFLRKRLCTDIPFNTLQEEIIEVS